MEEFCGVINPSINTVFGFPDETQPAANKKVTNMKALAIIKAASLVAKFITFG